MAASGMTTNTITKAYKLMFISNVIALITKFPTHMYSVTLHRSYTLKGLEMTMHAHQSIKQKPGKCNTL